MLIPLFLNRGFHPHPQAKFAWPPNHSPWGNQKNAVAFFAVGSFVLFCSEKGNPLRSQLQATDPCLHMLPTTPEYQIPLSSL